MGILECLIATRIHYVFQFLLKILRAGVHFKCLILGVTHDWEMSHIAVVILFTCTLTRKSFATILANRSTVFQIS